MARITFEDKEATKTSSLPRKNLITDDDINEIKASVNDLYNNVEQSTDEQEIGTYLGKTLYRKTIVINKSQITFNNGLFTYDTTSLGAEEVFVDLTHTYLLNVITRDNGDNKEIKTHYIPNSALMSNASNFTNLKNYSFSIYNADREVVEIFVGTSLQNYFSRLYLTLEYTKE